jgi:hypothetical protein
LTPTSAAINVAKRTPTTPEKNITNAAIWSTRFVGDTTLATSMIKPANTAIILTLNGQVAGQTKCESLALTTRYSSELFIFRFGLVCAG